MGSIKVQHTDDDQDDDHDWIQGGTCLLRPFTCVLHCALVCPCYLISASVLFVIIFLRGLLQCIGFLPSAPEPVTSKPGTVTNKPRIFFDGAGWAFPFSLGASQFIIENYDVPQSAIYAISAGNIGAICLLLNKDPRAEIRKHYPALRRAAVYSHLRQPLFGYCNTLQFVRATIEQLVPDDIHTLASGRYHAVVTPWPHLGLRFVNTFASKREFVDAVVASMAVPPFVYRPLVSRHAGWPGLWVDGGLQVPPPKIRVRHRRPRSEPDKCRTDPSQTPARLDPSQRYVRLDPSRIRARLVRVIFQDGRTEGAYTHIYAALPPPSQIRPPPPARLPPAAACAYIYACSPTLNAGPARSESDMCPARSESDTDPAKASHISGGSERGSLYPHVCPPPPPLPAHS